MYRFAPSPTGDMHIGNLRTAILNFIAAKQSGKGFILRIEDTDKARNIDGKEKEIFEILEIFGISWDQLYYQSKNLKFHREFAHKLLLEKKAFCCFCSESELEMKKEKAKKDGVAYRYDGTCEKLSDEEVLNCEKPFVIRMKKPNSNVKFKDEIKGEFEFSPEAVDSFVIMRADKTPTYNFACGVDDMLMDIDFIIRGEDHVSNTPKQEWIRESLGYKKSITYAHLPIILNENGKKMSKRESDSSVKFLLKKGYLPEAIANYLILLGNKTPCEIFTIAEAIEWFDIKNISKSPAKFDIKRLDQLNRAHILRASDERISEIFGLDKKYADLVKFYTQESSLVSEIKEKIFKIHSQTKDFGEFETEAKILRDEILKMEIPLNFDEFKSYLMSATNLKGKRFFMPLRVLLTGSSHGPELSELYPLIRDEIKENI